MSRSPLVIKVRHDVRCRVFDGEFHELHIGKIAAAVGFSQVPQGERRVDAFCVQRV